MDKVGKTLNTMFKGIRPVANSPRTMKFPYTLGAQVAQFPWKYYWDNNWNFKYLFIGFACSMPAFVYIHKMANSPANVAKWAEIRRKEALEEGHH